MRNRIALVGLAVSTSLLFQSVAAAVAPVPPMAVPGKEYSHHIDIDAAGMPDPEQTIFWDGTGVAFDTFDFTPGGGGPPRTPTVHDEVETDALANTNDALFHPVRGNLVPLIFSTDLDGSIYSEETGGAGAVWATPAVINMAVPPKDVDAIEVWGPDSTAAASFDDAFNYSLHDPTGVLTTDPAGVAVWHIPGSAPGVLGGAALPLLTDIEIATAIAALGPAGTTPSSIVEHVNLDGMMLFLQTFDLENPDVLGGVRIGSIHFTIDPITTAAGVVFDGGEIFTWDFDTTAALMPATFLSHGGHLWDTAFGVMATFGTATENVNGLEAVEEIPEPSTCLLAAFGLCGLLAVARRRKR